MSNYDALRERVCEANLEISRTKLAILTWGNASEVDREAGVFAIKPSGVDYDALTPDAVVVVDLETGEKLEGDLNPSSDTATHWHLYRAFSEIGEIAHAVAIDRIAKLDLRLHLVTLGHGHFAHVVTKAGNLQIL